MKKVRTAIILTVAVLAVIGTAYAAPTRIGSITNGIEAPTRVALDAQGNVYVSETDANRVSKFNAQGALVGTVQVPRPYGIAVTSSGTVYVCSLEMPAQMNGYENRSSVIVLSSALAKIGTLGAAQGEFGGPVDIDIDGSGSLYVADMKNGVVKVYNAQGAFQYSMGAGYLREKWVKAVAVNDTAGEVYVIDSVKTTIQTYVVDAPRISVFSKNGSLLRSFGQYGTEFGKMMVPSDIAIDRSGTLYVADLGNNVVHMLNPADGTVVGQGGLSADPVALPASGVAIGKNGLLAVAWAPTHSPGRVDIYGLDGFVTMSTSPKSLVFEARQYSGNPSALTVDIANTGTGTLTWSASASADWITLGTQDPVAGGATGKLAVGVDISKLTAGAYSGTVTITSDFGQKDEIGVTLTVLQPLVLTIGNGSPSFSVRSGSAAVSQSITIGIDGGAGSWTLGTAGLPSWLSVSPTTGGFAATTVTFTANPAGLAAQDAAYVAYIPVAAAGVTGDGSTITVTLKVNASRIVVTTNRADASFKITGPANFNGTGKDWSTATAPAGDYTVTFENLAGFKRPFSQTKTLAATGEISFSGNYASWQELAARKNIVVAKGPDSDNDSQVKVFKNNGTQAGFDLIALSTMSGASVAVGDVDGNGAADLIVGAGKGERTPATVRIYRVADKSVIAEFVPFGTQNGASVAAGDLDGDGQAEVIVSDNNDTIAIFKYANGRMVPTGVTLTGRAAAVADTAFDGRPEVATVSGDGVKIWNIDLARGTATVAREIEVSGNTIAAADVDGDGRDDLIIGSNHAENGRSTVTIVKADGTQTPFKVFDRNSVTVAAADLDGDGIAEVIVGIATETVAQRHGTKMDRRRETVQVQVYGADGTQKFMINPFETAKEGVNLAVGDLGL